MVKDLIFAWTLKNPCFTVLEESAGLNRSTLIIQNNIQEYLEHPVFDNSVCSFKIFFNLSLLNRLLVLVKVEQRVDYRFEKKRNLFYSFYLDLRDDIKSKFLFFYVKFAEKNVIKLYIQLIRDRFHFGKHFLTKISRNVPEK
jgi:hypothetical protein